MDKKKIIFLFDVDGTLTKSRGKIEESMIKALAQLSEKVTISAIGGSDYAKIKEQLGDTIKYFTNVYSENGLVTYEKEKVIHRKKINDYLSEDQMKEFVNYFMNYIADLDIPKKRGTFIELRSGMYNISPIGRNCSQEEREEFYEYNKTTRVLETMRDAGEKEFGSRFGLNFTIGGQISFDVVPIGWTKSYCLQFVEKEYDTIIFFGDKIYEGGNDYEIAIDSRVTKYYKTESPSETIKLINEALLEFNI